MGRQETDAVLVYVTCPDVAVARTISSALLEQGLIACANILPEMTAVFRWDGAVQTETESVLILKTTRRRGDDVVDRVVAAHPYDEPAVVVLPVVGGAPSFLAWIRDETDPMSQTAETRVEDDQQ